MHKTLCNNLISLFLISKVKINLINARLSAVLSIQNLI